MGPFRIGYTKLSFAIPAPWFAFLHFGSHSCTLVRIHATCFAFPRPPLAYGRFALFDLLWALGQYGFVWLVASSAPPHVTQIRAALLPCLRSSSSFLVFVPSLRSSRRAAGLTGPAWLRSRWRRTGTRCGGGAVAMQGDEAGQKPPITRAGTPSRGGAWPAGGRGVWVRWDLGMRCGMILGPVPELASLRAAQAVRWQRSHGALGAGVVRVV